MNIVLLEKGERLLPLTDERTKHVRKVLHKVEGGRFLAGEVNGMEGEAEILSIKEEGMALSFVPHADSSALHPLVLIVAQTRPICMRRILREAVSLGVEEIILPVSDKGEKSYAEAGLYTSGEYRSILLDGAMQAGKTGVSRCLIVKNVEEAVAAAGEGEKLLLDNVIGARDLSSMDLSGRRVILAVGPERGWSDREREYFLSMGYIPTLMGSRILRTETACVAGSALALSRMGLL